MKYSEIRLDRHMRAARFNSHRILTQQIVGPVQLCSTNCGRASTGRDMKRERTTESVIICHEKITPRKCAARLGGPPWAVGAERWKRSRARQRLGDRASTSGARSDPTGTPSRTTWRARSRGFPPCARAGSDDAARAQGRSDGRCFGGNVARTVGGQS